MMRSSTGPPGSTLMTSGSASVRSLARNASYFTSFKSGAVAALLIAVPDVDFAILAAGAIPAVLAELDVDPPPIEAMLPPFFSASKICSGGVKLKSASIMTTSC